MSKITGQQVLVEKVQTNIFSNVRIKNFRIQLPGDSLHNLVSFKRLDVEYNLWSLLFKKIKVTKIELDEPKIYLYRDPNGKFNLPEAFVSAPADTTTKVAEKKSGFAFQLNRATISKMSAEYRDEFDSLHVNLPEIDASLSSAMLANKYHGKLHIGQGELQWANARDQFKELKLDVDISSEKIKIGSLELITESIRLFSSGSYDLKNQSIEAGKIDCSLKTTALNKLLGRSAEDTVRSFSGELNLWANLEGPVQQPSGNASLVFAAGTLYNFPIENLNIDLKIENQQYNLSQLSLNAFGGQLSGTGSVSMKNEVPVYDLQLSLDHFKLNELLRTLYGEPTFEPQGLVSGNLHLKGESAVWNEVFAEANLKISDLFVQSQKFGDVGTTINVDHGRISFGLKQNHSFINLVSSFHPDSTIKGQVEGMFSNIESIAGLANIQDLKGQLDFKGQVQGSFENPSASLDFQFQNGEYKGIPIGLVNGFAAYRDSLLTLSDVSATGETDSLQALTYYWPIDSLQGRFRYKIAANGPLDRLQASAKIEWDNCRFNTFSLDSLRLDALYASKEISINKLSLNKKLDQIVLSGKVDTQENIVADLGIQILKADTSMTAASQGRINIAGTISGNEINSVITGQGIQFAPLLAIASVPMEIDGELSFDSYVYGPPGAPNFNLTWMISRLGFRQNRLDSLNGKISFADDHLSISRILASRADGEIVISGDIPIALYQGGLLPSPAPHINIAADDFNLSFLQNFMPDSISVAGRLFADLHATGPLQHPEINGYLNIADASFAIPGFAPLDTVFLKTEFNGHDVDLTDISGKFDTLAFSFYGKVESEEKRSYAAWLNGSISDLANIEFNGRYAPDDEQTAHIKINRLNLGSISKVYPLNFTLAGYVDMAASYSDSSETPIINFSAKSDRMGVDRAVLDSLRFFARTEDHDLILSESGFKINNGWIKFGGHVPFNMQPDSTQKIIKDIDFFSHAENMNIAWLIPFLPSLETIQGVANYKIFLTGSAEAPVFNGYFFLQNGQVKIKNLETPIQSINIALQAENNDIKLDDFSGALGGGTFKLKGETRLVENEPTNSSLKLTLDKPTINVPNIFKFGITNGELTLTQHEENLKLKGGINLSETKYVQDFKPKISEILTQIPNRPQQETTDFLNKILLDVNIQGQENIWVENNIAKIKLTSNINLFGTLAKPNLSGRIAVNKGYVLYLDRKFKITEGLIDFSDPLKINPYINLTATCTVTDYQSIKETSYEITLKLSGLLEKPDFVLTSNPTLEKADIVAVLMVGRTRGTMFTASETGKTTTFQDLMVDRFKELTSRRLAGMTEQRLGRALSLESISIEGNLFQVDKNWGPKVTATKQLSDRINITYSTVVGHANEQQIKLGYQLYKYLSVIGNTGQTGQSGLDLKFNFKFY